MTSTPIRVGIIGMGGYAARHHEAILQLEASREARLVCTCDPAPQAFAAKMAEWKFEGRGVAIHNDYRKMLERHAGELDVVTVPTPIPLHAEMHRAGVERGLAVYLEKPPTLDPRELERMIAADAKAKVPTLVGFNFITEQPRQAIKRRLLKGEFGALRSAHLLGLWPRGTDYFTRNTWAGRLVGDDGRLILDSCVGNALSHHVHNILHWAGTGAQDRWATPTKVRASLLRAHDIQGADTFFLSIDTDTGVPIRIALTHACMGPHIHRETLVCDRATIDYITNDRADIRWHAGGVETVRFGEFDAQVENFRAFFACFRTPAARPPTTLPDSRPFVHLHALSYIAAGQIQRFPADLVSRVTGDDSPSTFVPVRGIAELCERFLADGAWPFGKPGSATPSQLDQLDAVVRRMAGER